MGNDSNDELIDYDKVEKEWHIPKGTVRAWVSRSQIPHIRLSPRCVRFRRSDLKEWLASRSVKVANDNFAPLREAK